MSLLKNLYKPSLSLMTDLYQLTMAYAHWKHRAEELEGVFHLFFRRNPFGGGYAVACGMETAAELVEQFRYRSEDIKALAALKGNDGRALFEKEFLTYLSKLRLRVDIDAVADGTLAFAREPLMRVRGPLLHCQLLETALLTIVNFQTLVATKTARVCGAAKGDPVIEFGARRAQGIDGAISAARAAFIGGASATSNVLAGQLLGIPVRGTHAHSWVMSFDSELEAFEKYAEAMPNNCVFLVDTYDTLQGVRNAVTVGQKLRKRGYEMAGIRLDSGDLAFLSIKARRILDQGGFPKASIVASNDLDETTIASLKEQGARINVWGIGTKMVTAQPDGALGGVYKLGAVRRHGGAWEHRIKLSEQVVKITDPGILNTRRFRNAKGWIGDMIFDEEDGAGASMRIVDPKDPTREKLFSRRSESETLLRPMFRSGRRVSKPEPIAESQARAREQLAMLHPTIRRLLNPHEYPVGLEPQLHERKLALVKAARDARREGAQGGQ
jgi:nicotinate phosphoribosyltransferase